MGLHLSVIEQVTTDRPQGIRDIYQTLIKKLGSPLDAEHVMMDCVIENLWHAQTTGEVVSDEAYIEQLKKLLKNRKS